METNVGLAPCISENSFAVVNSATTVTMKLRHRRTIARTAATQQICNRGLREMSQSKPHHKQQSPSQHAHRTTNPKYVLGGRERGGRGTSTMARLLGRRPQAKAEEKATSRAQQTPRRHKGQRDTDTEDSPGSSKKAQAEQHFCVLFLLGVTDCLLASPDTSQQVAPLRGSFRYWQPVHPGPKLHQCRARSLTDQASATGSRAACLEDGGCVD